MNRRKRTIPLLAIFLLTPLLTGACEEPPPPAEPLAFAVTFGDHEITLTHAPNEIAEDPVESRPMELVWEFRSLELESVASIGDIRLHGDDGLVISDWLSPQILLYDRSGLPPKRIVREGPGPGETSRLFAVLSTGSHIVGWGTGDERAFLTFRDDGTPRATIPTPVEGDWRFIFFRDPPMAWERTQMTVEYTSDRLVRLNADHFIHILQDNEQLRPNPGADVPIEDLWTSAILYDLDGQVLDTLARYPAPRTRHTADGMRTVQDLYAGRLRISGSAHHLAITHGDSAHVRIEPRDPADGTNRTIRWTSFRPPLGPDAVQHQVDTSLDQALMDSPEFVEMWRGASAATRRRELSTYFDDLNYIPDLAPELTRVWSDGTCVFLSGFRFPDSYDGTSARMVGIDLEAETYEILMVDQPLFRIRDISRGRVLVTTRTDDSAWGVHVYEHGLLCG